MKLLAILLAGLMVGCASTPPPRQEVFIPQPERSITTERWPDGKYIFAPTKQYVGPAPLVSEDVDLLIDVANQSFHYYEDGRAVFSGPVSTGKYGNETPKGVFYAGIKSLNKRSSLYPKPNGGAPMHYAIQVDGDIFLHEGYLPGHPASHGCIRVWTVDAQKLYKRIQRNDRIVVI